MVLRANQSEPEIMHLDLVVHKSSFFMRVSRPRHKPCQVKNGINPGNKLLSSVTLKAPTVLHRSWIQNHSAEHSYSDTSRNFWISLSLRLKAAAGWTFLSVKIFENSDKSSKTSAWLVSKRSKALRPFSCNSSSSTCRVLSLSQARTRSVSSWASERWARQFFIRSDWNAEGRTGCRAWTSEKGRDAAG